MHDWHSGRTKGRVGSLRIRVQVKQGDGLWCAVARSSSRANCALLSPVLCSVTSHGVLEVSCGGSIGTISRLPLPLPESEFARILGWHS